MRLRSAIATARAASASLSLVSSSGLSIVTRTCPAATSLPRWTGRSATRPSTRAAMSTRVASASPWTRSGCGWTRYQSDRPTIAAIESATMMAAARGGLARLLGIAAFLGRAYSCRRETGTQRLHQICHVITLQPVRPARQDSGRLPAKATETIVVIAACLQRRKSSPPYRASTVQRIHLTFLSNVVAYACRPSSTEDRHDVHQHRLSQQARRDRPPPPVRRARTAGGASMVVK